MNAIGWQIGAILFGISSVIIAVYISKLLNETTKSVNKVNNIIDYNQKSINEIIDDTAKITKRLAELTDIMDKVFGVLKILNIFRKR